MSDLVAIARSRAEGYRVSTHWGGCEIVHTECLIQNMADEIERLEAECAALREALQSIYNTALGYPYAGNTCGEIAKSALDAAKGKP